MPAIRFRSRHLHATLYQDLLAALTSQGWVSSPVNFGTDAVTVVDYQPDERTEVIKSNTVAISLGDFDTDVDEEMGALGGGLRSALYQVYVDVYMAQQPLSYAICDDVRDHFADRRLSLIDQVSGSPVPGTRIAIETVIGPARPAALSSAEAFKRYWRIMRVDTRLYYPS